MFSSRLPAGLHANRIAESLAEVRRSGAVLFDLTETNPTAVKLRLPPDDFSALADPRVSRYEPHPFGLEEARCAAAATYRPRATVPAGRVVLSASTSEAYSFLFKLLC